LVDDDAIGPAQRRERRPVGVWADCDKTHAMQGCASVVPAQADDVGDRDIAGRCEGIGGGTVVGRQGGHSADGEVQGAAPAWSATSRSG